MADSSASKCCNSRYKRINHKIEHGEVISEIYNKDDSEYYTSCYDAIGKSCFLRNEGGDQCAKQRSKYMRGYDHNEGSIGQTVEISIHIC